MYERGAGLGLVIVTPGTTQRDVGLITGGQWGDGRQSAMMD